MSRRAAVSIGVDRPRELPPLSAAASGAHDFADWARTQGCDVVELTDTGGNAVTASDIKKAVFEFVRNADSYSQIILYFAGHGMLLGPENEVWWLSGAPEDTSEAVNLVESTINARACGIPHVVWISDACRSLPDSLRPASVRGVSVFPNRQSQDLDTDVDFLYASRPGEPALEARIEEAGSNYKGLFTSCLLEGLCGTVDEVIEIMNGQRAVPTWALKPYLKVAVPKAAARVQVTLRQVPDIRAESHPPAYLARLNPPVDRLESFRGSTGPRPAPSIAALAQPYDLDQFFLARKATVIEPMSETRLGFGEEVERILKVKGRSSFESRTGLSIFGGRVKTVDLSKGECDVFEQDGAQQISVRTEGAGSVLMEFEGGTATCLGVLPGYIATVLVEDGRVINVSYAPSRGTPLYRDYIMNAEELDKRRAFAAVASRQGYMHLDKKSAAQFDGYLRQMKNIDPTLALYAVYAYAQAGLFKEIESVYQFMTANPDAYVPYDVAMLARRPADNRAVPFCPMITQGWSMLRSFVEGPELLFEMTRFLIPALWTTMTAEGAALLRPVVQSGGFH